MHVIIKTIEKLMAQSEIHWFNLESQMSSSKALTQTGSLRHTFVAQYLSEDHFHVWSYVGFIRHKLWNSLNGECHFLPAACFHI